MSRFTVYTEPGFIAVVTPQGFIHFDPATLTDSTWYPRNRVTRFFARRAALRRRDELNNEIRVGQVRMLQAARVADAVRRVAA